MRTERTVSRTGHVRAFTEASGLRKDTITASEAAPSIAAPILLPNSDIVSPYADPSSHLSTRPVDLCAHDSGGASCYWSAPVRACTSALLLLLLLAWADRLLFQAAQVPSMHTTAKRSRER